MSSEVKNSHYITRGLTRSWEAEDRRLYFYDLATRTLGWESSKTLFAVPGLHSTSTEQKLSRLVEDAVGKYRTLCMRAGGSLVDFNNADPRVPRALVALVILQGQRTREALVPGAAELSLDALLADDRALDFLIDATLQDFQLVGGSLPRGEWLAFPSCGWFAIPVIGYKPALAVPIVPGAFVALLERGATTDGLTDMVRTSRMLTTFSLLGEGVEHKLVLPASLVEQNDPASVCKLVETIRENGHRIFNLIGRAALTAGLDAWGYQGAERSST